VTVLRRLRPSGIANREVVAELEWNRFAHGREGRLERAKALLEVLKR
jgi:hypothetical protein